MNNQFLISNFSVIHHYFQNIHSAGPELFFLNPCLAYIKNGCAKFLYNGKTFYAGKGDLIYIAYETKYQSIWYGSPDIEWYQINFDFPSKYSFYEYRFQILKNYPSNLIDKICDSYNSSPMLSVSYLYRLLDDMYKTLHPSILTNLHSSIDPAIYYIKNNYDKHIPITTLANLCHISVSTLFEQFKRFYGVTPIAYKHNIMIQYAIDLLSNTELSIEEISRKVGFSSSNYFRKIFIKLTDKTPKELRKKYT